MKKNKAMLMSKDATSSVDRMLLMIGLASVVVVVVVVLWLLLQSLLSLPSILISLKNTDGGPRRRTDSLRYEMNVSLVGSSTISIIARFLKLPTTLVS